MSQKNINILLLAKAVLNLLFLFSKVTVIFNKEFLFN